MTPRLRALIPLIGLALSLIPGPALAQKPRAERPTYALGEKWIRTDGVYELIRIENDLYVFAASSDRQIHLTKDLMPVEGLKGAADLNRDGIVTLQELYEFVEREVGAKSRAVGGNQHPLMKGELEGLLPLVKVQRR